MIRLPRFLPLLLGSVLLCSLSPGRIEGAQALGFYSPTPDPGAGLPADGVYPLGRKLAFMGYSGVPARDLTNGFTIAGPIYGQQLPYLERCFSNGWPAIAHIGP